MKRFSLNDHFDAIYILNVDSRGLHPAELNTQLCELADEWQWHLVGDGRFADQTYLHIDTDAPVDWRGTRQSFNYYHSLWKLIEYAQQQKDKNFLFLEDDAWFQLDFATFFQSAILSLEYCALWDMLYLGANHHESETELVAQNVLRLSCSLDMHAVAISHTMYQPILDLQDAPKLNENPYADITIAHLFHKSKICYALHPSMVYQRAGMSFNENTVLDRTQNWKHPGRLKPSKS